MDVRVATGVDVRFVSDDGVEEHPVEELASLLEREDGIVWVDIPVCDEAAARVLSESFGFHPLAIQACVERNAVPKVRAYRDHVFVVLHAPELGTGGHVHYVELDQFIGARYLVTVHGPVTRRSLRRLRSARPVECCGASRPAGCAHARRSTSRTPSCRPWPKARRPSWRP